MTKNFLLLTLLTLISCGKDKDSSSTNKGEFLVDFPMVFADKLSAQEKADVVAKIMQDMPESTFGTGNVTSTTGKLPELKEGQVVLVDKNFVVEEVVLKKENGEVYTLEIKSDLIEQKEFMSITLAQDSNKELEEELLSSNLSLAGDVLSFSKETPQNNSVMSGFVSISKPCNATVKYGTKGHSATLNGKEIKVPSFVEKLVITCGTKQHTREEFEALDLSSIMFCDQKNATDGSIQCEEKDMSFLKN